MEELNTQSKTFPCLGQALSSNEEKQLEALESLYL